jgi:erythromycin esterase-like protein
MALIDRLAAASHPLTSQAGLDPLIELIGGARFVLMGEATHGTSEFYAWRAALTQRLVRERGFSFVAVEGDWPDCYRVNRYVKGLEPSGTPEATLRAFERWPTWMWANREVAAFVGWLRAYNDSRPASHRVGFYGLDVYSLSESMNAVVEYLEGVDPALARAARAAYSCFDPYSGDPEAYAQATALVPTSCEDEAVAVLRALRQREDLRDDNPEDHFVAAQNAMVARDAERYYRTMIRGGPSAWNIRDGHMVDTLDNLMIHHGDGAKGIVWAHNTHIGDARYTDMLQRGLLNIGQLVRERHSSDGACLIGFGTYRGSVIAGSEWGAPMRRIPVPPARENSWEDLLHRTGRGDLILRFRSDTVDGGIRGLEKPHDHRAIGVVYDPRMEKWGNYVPTVLPGRYDAFIFVDESHAVDPIHVPVKAGEVGETYPTGM